MENNQNSKSDSSSEPHKPPTANGFHPQNPNSDLHRHQESPDGSPEPSQPDRSSRTPFTDLNQVDADLILARTLQEQERAYMMLRMNNEGSDYGSWEAGSYLQDDEDDFNDLHDESDVEEELEGSNNEDGEDSFDVHDDHHDDSEEEEDGGVELDPGSYSSDEAFARALQDAEDREMATRLAALVGLGGRDEEDSESEDHGHSQDGWEEVDPDELSYEELLALGEVVGTESRGLSADTIASLPSVNYKTGSSQSGSNDSCVICRLDYDDGETLTLLSCKHSYHPECINNWLNINKVCPVCSTEVTTSSHS